MSQEEEVTQWAIRLADGDQEAAGKLWNEYFLKLTRLAKRKMDGMPLRDADEEDIALSAMNSFCNGMAARKFDGIRNRTDLWKLLVTITARKATAKRRKDFAQKRGGGGVRGESIFMQGNGENDWGIGDMLGKEPVPELALGVQENCRLLLDKLEDDVLRKIALRTLEGFRPDEIASELNCARRTVERKLERIREIWADEMREREE